MAQGVRSRIEVAGAAAALLALAACDQEPAEPEPRAVDLAAIADGDLVSAVLDECHRPLRGVVDRIAAVVRPAGGGEVRLFAQLPDRLRTVGEGGNFLLADREVHELRGDGSTPAGDADAARVRALRTLLDAALLGPLHRATGCRRTGPAAWQVEQPDGAWIDVALRPGTLLPDRIGDVRLERYHRTSTTWIVRRAEHPALGRCELEFVFGDVTWAPDFLAVPKATDAAARPATVRMPAAAGEPRSPTPIVVRAPAAAWIVVDDPVDWAKRAQVYTQLHAELVRQDQHVAGFPILFTEGERARLAAPFRARPGKAAFAAPDGWTIRDLPAGAWLVCYPPGGDPAAKIAAGERLLREALAAQGREAAGPIAAQPWLHLQEGVPGPEQVGAAVVRMSVPLR